ncbi:MAG TPA: nitrous oxide reductase accessory protein NosL [Desulfosarcina sp.]|nr:nitrous oxide reductase accessory protein NosL [Desulfosarcina sp.]
MKLVNRRNLLKSLVAAPIGLALSPNGVKGMECRVQHPMMPPNNQYEGQCPVCGMLRSMWVRTWITFDEVKNVSQVCSFHCLADWIQKFGQEPTNVTLTLYHQPDTRISANDAVIVIGSTAVGTMSPVSKIVFADKTKAEDFAEICSGEIVDYTKALMTAKANVVKENAMNNARRLKNGKIIEPNENDNCPVCGMFPARYPYGKCQIKTKDGQTIHFCSTQCLFAFLGKQKLYVDGTIDPLLIWVVDRTSGMWISGKAAFFVIGSTKAFGPMGYEALPFNSLEEAEEFTVSNGGKMMVFDQVTIEKIVPGWKHPST